MATTGLPLPTNALPSSNPAGNNQTSPGLSAMPTPQPIFTPALPAGSVPSNNPYLSATPGSPIGMGTTGPSAGLVPGTTSPGGLYNPASSYSSGQTDISKQLTDIYGKGIGGSLNYALQGMSGTDSAIFQQYLASMQPQMAKAQAQLTQGLGSMGVSGNSSVQGLAQADLQSQFLAQESGVNANLMQQQMQNTLGVLQGAQGAATQEVASSPWQDLGQVVNTIANVAGSAGGLMSGLGALKGIGGAVGSIMGNFAAPQLGGVAGAFGDVSGGMYSGSPFSGVNLSPFQSALPAASLDTGMYGGAIGG